MHQHTKQHAPGEGQRNKPKRVLILAFPPACYVMLASSGSHLEFGFLTYEGRLRFVLFTSESLWGLSSRVQKHLGFFKHLKRVTSLSLSNHHFLFLPRLQPSPLSRCRLGVALPKEHPLKPLSSHSAHHLVTLWPPVSHSARPQLYSSPSFSVFEAFQIVTGGFLSTYSALGSLRGWKLKDD